MWAMWLVGHVILNTSSSTMYMYLFWASSTLMPSLLFNTCEVAISSSFSSLQWHWRCASGSIHIFSFLVLRFFLPMRLWSLEPYDNWWGLGEKQNRISPLWKQLESTGRRRGLKWRDGLWILCLGWFYVDHPFYFS